MMHSGYAATASPISTDRDFDPMAQWLGLKVLPATYMVNEPRLTYG
jgi:hypothetical protein